MRRFHRFFDPVLFAKGVKRKLVWAATSWSLLPLLGMLFLDWPLIAGVWYFWLLTSVSVLVSCGFLLSDVLTRPGSGRGGELLSIFLAVGSFIIAWGYFIPSFFLMVTAGNASDILDANTLPAFLYMLEPALIGLNSGVYMTWIILAWLFW